MKAADVMQLRNSTTNRTPRLAALVAGLVAALLGAFALSGTAGAATPSVSDLDELEVAILKKVNEVRRDEGLVALRSADALDRAAGTYARAMGQQGFFSHVPPSGVSLKTRLSAFYPPQDPRRWRIGEVMLWRSTETAAADVVRTWLASGPHRAVLLEPAFREIGIGAVHVSNAPSTFGGAEATIVVSDLGAGG